MEILVQFLLSITAVFLVLLILVQRGRGGGLAGALGGPGGSSAFGAKAGDTFTQITMWAATFWILLCVASSYWVNHRGDALSGDESSLIQADAAAGSMGAGPTRGADAPQSEDEAKDDSAASDGEASEDAAASDGGGSTKGDGASDAGRMAGEDGASDPAGDAESADDAQKPE